MQEVGIRAEDEEQEPEMRTLARGLERGREKASDSTVTSGCESKDQRTSSSTCMAEQGQTRQSLAGQPGPVAPLHSAAVGPMLFMVLVRPGATARAQCVCVQLWGQSCQGLPGLESHIL